MAEQLSGSVLARRDLWQEDYDRRMAQIENMPVRLALARGVGFKCPTCRLVHPGIYYTHPDHRKFCSRKCFKERVREQ